MNAFSIKKPQEQKLFSLALTIMGIENNTQGEAILSTIRQLATDHLKDTVKDGRVIEKSIQVINCSLIDSYTLSNEEVLQIKSQAQA
jgi:hypothetical protein